jgi:hypothetical protein
LKGRAKISSAATRRVFAVFEARLVSHKIDCAATFIDCWPRPSTLTRGSNAVRSNPAFATKLLTEKGAAMHRIKTLPFGLSLLLFVVFATVLSLQGFASNASSVDSKYRVFCANNKIEVEQRTLEQQKNARGSNVCMLAEYDTLSDAEKYAEQQGGKGAECKCP